MSQNHVSSHCKKPMVLPLLFWYALLQQLPWCQPLLKAKYCPRLAQCLMSDTHHIFDPVYVTFVWGSAYSTGFYKAWRTMPVQHFVNPGQMVRVVACIHKNTQNTPMWPWPLTLIFNRLLEVVEVHVRAEFHQAKCSGSWVIVLTEREKNLATMLKTIPPSLLRAVIKATLNQEKQQNENQRTETWR